jgi:hypothetical protein
LNFTFDQREIEVNLHKATSSPSNVSPACLFLPAKTYASPKHKKILIKSAKARVTGTIPYCHGKVPHSRKLLSLCSNEFCSSKINGLVMKTEAYVFAGKNKL